MAVDLLTELIAACKCEVSVTVNEHRNYYLTAEKFLQECDDRESPPEIAADVRAEMLRLNVVVEVRAYSSTPIGFYSVMHWDLETALRLVLDAVRQEA